MCMPMPNHTMNSGASATFGIAYSAIMNGSSTRYRKFSDANTNPTSTPAAAPRRNPYTISCTVIHVFVHKLPSSTQSPRRPTMSLGRLMNVMSIHRSAAISHSASRTTTSASRTSQTVVVVPYFCHQVRSRGITTGPLATGVSTTLTTPPP